MSVGSTSTQVGFPDYTEKREKASWAPAFILVWFLTRTKCDQL